jgi:glycosyltransferase involved in cell wall biosynthesis
MKVGINGRVFGVDSPDGAAQVGIQYSENLLAAPGVDCRLYGPREAGRWFEDKIPLTSTGFRWNSQAYGVLWERTVMPTLAAGAGLDVLFCPNANAPPVTVGDYQTVMLVHHIGAEHGHSPIQRAYRRAMIPAGARQADALITVSEFSKKKIVERLPVADSDVHVVYNGVDNIFFEKGVGERVEVPEEYVLFVGSADERKNLRRLLTAYDELDPDEEMVVVGPQDSIAYGSEEVDRDDIINLGYVSRAELRYLYEHATLFAYPSLYEGFGLPPLEAAACGTPVVTSDVTAIPEVMGNAAEYVDPYDIDSIRAGLKILNDPDRLAELRNKGPARAERFTWQRATDELIDVFEKVA